MCIHDGFWRCPLGKDVDMGRGQLPPGSYHPFKLNYF